MEDKMRLNKYISTSGFCSRRKADEWIAAGKVYVNGSPADVGMCVGSEDVIEIGGKRIKPNAEIRVVAFYKPKGYSCTAYRGDDSGIFSNFKLDRNLKYIGRLDKDSEGLLLLTNNGDLCNEIARARNMHEKEYIATVNRPVTKEFLDGLAKGVPIRDTNRDRDVVTRPCKVKKQSINSFSIVLTQGYNRQIRRMCEYFEYRVRELKRIRVMNITLDGLQPGQLRELTGGEISELKRQIAESKGVRK